MNLGRKDLAAMAVSTALVAAATMVFSVFIPSTRGFFNVGEIMVYTTALLMGPWVGGFAGGVGSMVADLSLGYFAFAPGTLVIKGLEGFIVGYLARLGSTGVSKTQWRALTGVGGVIVAAVVWWIGTSYYSGEMELTIGLPVTGYSSTTINVPSIFWISLAVLAFLLILVGGLAVDPRVGWTALAVLIGGLEMVTGYFLYEYFVLGIGIAALAEIPFNMAQVTVGLIVAIPLSRGVAKVIGSRARVMGVR